MRRISRREFCEAAAATLWLSACAHAAGPRAPGASKAALAEVPQEAFAHGVASGDPTNTAVILWTRLTVPGGGQRVVRFRVAEDPELTRVVREGSTLAAPERDHTVKVDADQLEPGRTYFYRFEVDESGAKSPVGRTRTLPVGDVAQVRFGVVSCSCFCVGYFNGYAHLAARDDVDAVLHLGDYI